MRTSFTSSRVQLKNNPFLLELFKPLVIAFLTAVMTSQGYSQTTWQGATTGGANSLQSGKTITDYEWIQSDNWNSSVPNAAGSSATFNTFTGTLTLYADTTAASTVTFGAINLNSNRSLNFGTHSNTDTTADLGNFVINGTGLLNDTAVITYNGPAGTGINNDRGIAFSGNKADYTTLATDLIVNMNLGANTHQKLTFNNRTGATGATQAGFNGGGNTITINGGYITIGQSGFNGNGIRNAVLDVRNGLQTSQMGASGVTANGVMNVSGGSSTNPATDVTVKIGTMGGQSITGANADSFRYQLFDKVNVGHAGSSNSKTFNGIFEAGNAEGSLNFTSTDARAVFTLAGSAANTYTGGSTVNLNWTAASGTSSATVGQARLLLSKDNALGTGPLSFGNNTSLVSLNALNNTIGGLRDGGAGFDQVGRANGAIIREDSTATAAPAQVTLDLKNTGTSTFGGSIGTSTLALGTNANMTVARQNNIALVKSGTGTQTLSGESYYTGGTSVTGGTLLINNTTGSGTGTGAVSVSSDAAIGGDGIISGNLTLASGAKFVFDLNDTPLTVLGTFALDSTFGVNDLVTSSLGAIDWSTVGLGTYTLLETSTVFNALNIQHYGAANAFVAAGKQMYFETGSLDLVVAIPEPGTLVLVGVSMLALLAFRKRR